MSIQDCDRKQSDEFGQDELKVLAKEMTNYVAVICSRLCCEPRIKEIATLEARLKYQAEMLEKMAEVLDKVHDARCDINSEIYYLAVLAEETLNLYREFKKERS